MAKTAILKVKIISDAAQASSGFDAVEKKSSKWAKGLKVAGGTALVVGGAVKVAYDKLAKPAGDLEQSIGAIDTVFKGNSKQVHAWAKGAATDVGLTRNEYNELGTLIGTQLKNGGTAMDQLGPKTNKLIGLGADLSSMFGGTSKEAVEALSSALKGERDPIEKYGVSLKQSAIDAEAARLGHKKVGGALSDEAQQAATLSLIYKQTKDAQGNFAKESDTLQGKQQRLTAQWENAKATLGTALLPVATKFFGFLADKAMPAVTNLINAFSGNGGGMGDLGKKLGLDKIGPIFTEVTGGLRSFVAAWKFNDGEVTSSGFPGYMERVGYAARQVFDFLKTAAQTVMPILISAFRTIGPPVLEVAEALLGLVSVVAQRLVPVIRFLAPFVQQVFSNILNIVKPVLSFIAALIRTVTAVIKGDWSGAWTGIKDMFLAVWDLIKAIVTNAIATVKLVLSTAWTAIKAAAGAAWTGIKALIGKAWDLIKADVSARVTAVKTVLSAAWTAIKTAASTAWTWVKDKVVGLVTGLKDQVTGRAEALGNLLRVKWEGMKNTAIRAWENVKARVVALIEGLKAGVSQRVEAVKTLFTGLPGKIKAALGNAGSMLLNAGSQIVQGLITGIKNKIGAVKDTLTGLTKNIPNWKGPLRTDKRLLEPAGAAIMGGLIRSIQRERHALRKVLTDVSRDVAGTSMTAPAFMASTRSTGRGPAARPGISGRNVINININGALVDRLGTARQLRAVLAELDLAEGRAVA